MVVSGYDVVAAQTVHARKTYEHPHIRFGHRYAEILDTTEDGRLRVDYSRFHDTLEDRPASCAAKIYVGSSRAC